MWTEFPSSQLEYRSKQGAYDTSIKAHINSVPNQHSLCCSGLLMLKFYIKRVMPVYGTTAFSVA